MRLWTIQTEAAAHALERDGVLCVPDRFADPDFRRAYSWMKGQMRSRIGVAPRAGQAMILAWLQYESADKPCPDLRNTGHLPRGTVGYRIELVVDPREVLLSDFENWHYVLNNRCLPASAADAERFGRCHLDEARQQSRDRVKEVNRLIRASWDRIFDLDRADPYVTPPRNEKQIQAALSQITRNQIIHMQRFTAR